MKIQFFGQSDIGRVRGTNEDYRSHVKINDNEHLFIIADGMGGHQAGEVASKLGTSIFVRNYRRTRKENWKIEKSMLYSLTRANSSILKKALSDPRKRGMGTTFTALVLTPKRANIIHVGDSRIYLIRKRKIKKLTTDHTFVEKMLQEGKINAEEAREHPQKNILYMSLGARESYVPEILNNIEIKNGDVITMCSDGLNNMLKDDEIKDISLNHKPQKSVRELIRLANKNGGTDNITIQVIHVGNSRSSKKPAPTRPPRKKKSLPVAMVFFSLCLLFAWHLNKNDSRLTGENQTRNPILSGQLLAGRQNPVTRKNQNLIQVDTGKIQTPLSARDLLFFSQDTVFLNRDRQVDLFSIKKQKVMARIPLPEGETLIPSAPMNGSAPPGTRLKGERPSDPTVRVPLKLYVLLRKKTASLRYQVIDLNQREVMCSIQSDPELNSIDHESRIIKFQNLKPPLVPLFINREAFIFHDRNYFYVIENPIINNSHEMKFYRIGSLSFSRSGITATRMINRVMTTLIYDDQGKTVDIFEIPGAQTIPARPIRFKFTEKPLNMEYLDQNSIVFYFTFGYITLKPNNAFVQDYYRFRGENLLAQKVLINLETSERMVLDRQNRIFLLQL